MAFISICKWEEIYNLQGEWVAEIAMFSNVGMCLGLICDGKHCAPRGSMTAPPYLRYGQDMKDRTFNFACDIVHYGSELFQRGGVGRVLAP